MKVRVVVLSVALSSVMSGCEKPDSGGAATLSGDMTGATGLAVTKPSASASFQAFGEATPTPTPAEPFSTLVKIDENGVPSPVFNQQRQVFGVILSPSHVVVAGNFHDVRATVAEGEDEKAIDCYLVAFPRSATGEAVKCLSERPTGRHLLGSDSPDPDPPLGMAVRGEDFYFTVAYGESEESQVWRWTGGADQVELLLQFAPESPAKFGEVHAMENAGFVCVQTLPNVYWEALCTPVDTLDWQPSSATSEQGFSQHSLTLGTNLLLAGSILHLTDATVTPSTVNTLPAGPRNTIRVGNVAYGVTAGNTAPSETGCLGPNACLVRLQSDGTLTIFGETSPGSNTSALDWERIVGADEVAYVYGESDLRRFDMAAAVLGTANLLGSTSLLNITDMSLSTTPLIRIDGTTSAGLPSIVLINTSSGSITVTEEDVPRFVSVTPLD